MTTAAKFWDGLAEKYSRSPIRDMAAYEHTLDRTVSYLKKEDNVLELGCGTGRTALRLSGYVDTITASDVSPGMLAVGRRLAAEQEIENVAFVEADASHPPNWSYDVAMAFNLLHLVEDLEATLAQIHEVVKPGGLFISKTPCLAQGGLGFKFGLLKLLLPVMQLLGKAPFVNQLDIKTLESAIENAGFEIIESGNFPATPPSRYLVARKT
ncbi:MULTISPECIES: class I SAM-dependent methyltransferase [unclassified Ruegeria]|uniref:class I SAM-dependent methyltransferase n=1 Tax=unclassified Ruegeria TaxID=2625375 RepID=UPI00148819E2|nr:MULTISPECIES: class I SAM-dependent methyltransferase [unclassified Ruegeria]